MSFVVIGLNHATAPLEVLEQVTVPADGLDKVLTDVSRREHISEAVVLSTCNRTEIYVVAERFHGAYQDVRDFLCAHSFLPPEQLSDHLYTMHDEQAIRHLFEVSAGINSAVIGEHEILGQVKRAWLAAQEHGCAATSLNSIFRAALEVGKRVRTDTGISRNIASVSQAAIVLGEDRCGLADKQALLVGAGEMGSGMARSLADRNLASLTVMSRSPETAQDIASQVDAIVAPFSALHDSLVECDIAFMSTAAPSAVVGRDELASVMARRNGRQLVIIDVAMPRDVDAAAATLAGVDLCDLDTVGAFVAAGLESRAAELDAARSIVEREVVRHLGDEGARAMAPLITQFRSNAEDIRMAEMARLAPRLGSMTDEQIAAVDEITRSVLGKVLHTPTVRLKESSATLRGDRLASAVRELFDLD